jgi:uncharacterized membrane protein
VEELFSRFAEAAQRIAEAGAVLVVTFGTIEALFKLVWIGVTPRATHGERKAIWRRFGTWLLLGLEFELAADIVGSVVSPTWQDIGELGAIAVIRTFLNFFLERDLENAEEKGELQPGEVRAQAERSRAAVPARPASGGAEGQRGGE